MTMRAEAGAAMRDHTGSGNVAALMMMLWGGKDCRPSTSLAHTLLSITGASLPLSLSPSSLSTNAIKSPRFAPLHHLSMPPNPRLV